MVTLRDDRCRAPFCDAPIRDIDHIEPAKHGGATSYANASGLCARCNQIKENNLWRHRGGPDRLTVTTPTGHTYTTPTPGLFGDDPPPTGSPPTSRQGRSPDDDPPELRITDIHDYRKSELTFTRRVA